MKLYRCELQNYHHYPHNADTPRRDLQKKKEKKKTKRRKKNGNSSLRGGHEGPLSLANAARALARAQLCATRFTA